MVWDALIAVYLFLAGLGAGAFILSAVAGMAKKPALGMKKIGFIIAPIAVALGTLLLVIDARAGFADPLRFFFLVTNLSSVMAWGVIILSAFIVVSGIDLVLLLVTKKTPKALDILGIVLAVAVAAYTGVLLGDAAVAFPLWNAIVLPVLFVVSAVSTGFAAVLLGTTFIAPEDTKALPFLGKSGLTLPLIEAALVVILLAVTAGTAGAASTAASASVTSLVSGSYALLFWCGFVLIGLVLPFGIELSRFLKAKKQPALLENPSSSTKTLSVMGDAGTIIGGFLLRYLIVMAALPVVYL